jgi:hypothetical protein
MRGPGGALYVGTNAFGNGDSTVVRSTDGGRSWHVQPGYTGVYAYAFAFAEAVPEPPPGGLPQGAFVAADAFGLVYSHDGGDSWTTVPGMSYRFYDIAAVQLGPRDGGKAGRILAPTYDNSVGYPRVFASDDGGATWALAFEGPEDGGFFYVFVAPDGAVYAYSRGIDRSRHLFGSADGGETWQDLGPVGAEWTFGIEQLTVGPDGRLYAVGDHGQAGPNIPGLGEASGGVFRTTEAVVVASEPASPEQWSSFGLRIFPNPTGGAMVIALTGSATGEAVRVAVFDTLGREVALLHDGPASAGQRFAVTPGTLAPGSYVARAVSASGVATVTFTVAE